MVRCPDKNVKSLFFVKSGSILVPESTRNYFVHIDGSADGNFGSGRSLRRHLVSHVHGGRIESGRSGKSCLHENTLTNDPHRLCMLKQNKDKGLKLKKIVGKGIKPLQLTHLKGTKLLKPS